MRPKQNSLIALISDVIFYNATVKHVSLDLRSKDFHLKTAIATTDCMSKMAVATVRSPFGLGLNISAFAVKLDILKLESVD